MMQKAKSLANACAIMQQQLMSALDVYAQLYLHKKSARPQIQQQLQTYGFVWAWSLTWFKDDANHNDGDELIPSQKQEQQKFLSALDITAHIFLYKWRARPQILVCFCLHTTRLEKTVAVEKLVCVCVCVCVCVLFHSRTHIHFIDRSQDSLH